ncbi:hypothetical protein GCM10011579_034630 [Streptomyces albiflavescens]|uniref:Uncharacterized protein n=1 Tax=Streptomyces albiflavescens TaxID=1623582 RepID=A0A917Y3A6_9ACTN|nr:hypothetical protein GCM10011579_034630 [Streptomyces albiflavescens]
MSGARRHLAVSRVEGQLALKNVEVLVVSVVHVWSGTHGARGEAELLEGEVPACVLAGEPEKVRDTGDVYEFTVLGAA